MIHGTHKATYFLGWFSIALGVATIASPRSFTNALGTRDRTGLVRTVYGLREIAVGMGMLGSIDPQPYVWARVAGDALDMLTLASAHDEDNPKNRNVELAMLAVVGITALDVATATSLAKSRSA